MTASVSFTKLHPNAIAPSYGTASAAGADLYALLEQETVIPAGETVMIHTGIAMEIPEGFVGLIYARSGLACKRNLAPANKVGVIDSDYRGELIVALHNHGTIDQVILPSERIAQLVITPYLTASFVETASLSDTKRGAGGFGSTGRK